jgi:DnaJ-class molecular chaperone
MKRINEYKKLFEVEGEINLRELKKTYRGLIKTWHPDRVHEEDKKEVAEIKSLQIIDAYHFLVSIAPETKEAKLEEYTATVTEAKIEDYKHKSMLLEISFSDGSNYEYFGVNKKFFSKFHNAASQKNFARRNLFHSFLYRKAKRVSEE